LFQVASDEVAYTLKSVVGLDDGLPFSALIIVKVEVPRLVIESAPGIAADVYVEDAVEVEVRLGGTAESRPVTR
jgi:hypothetical protein